MGTVVALVVLLDRRDFQVKTFVYFIFLLSKLMKSICNVTDLQSIMTVATVNIPDRW